MTNIFRRFWKVVSDFFSNDDACNLEKIYKESQDTGYHMVFGGTPEREEPRPPQPLEDYLPTDPHFNYHPSESHTQRL